MSERFEDNIIIQEKEDEEYIKSRKLILDKVNDECDNAKDIIDLLNKSEEFQNVFFDYSKTLVEWPIIPIRKSDKFYIKKHTLTQRPYYHDHTFYELIYVHTGRCIQKIYGTAEDVVIGQKGAYLIFPGDIHALMKSRKEDIIFKIVIPVKLFEEKIRPLIELDKIKNTIITSKKVDFLIDKLLKEDIQKQSFNIIAMESYLQLIFIEFARSARKENKGDIEKQLDDYLLYDLQNATLSDFATKIGYNTDYVGKLLRRDYGKSFSQILLEYRLNRVKYLLENSSLLITEISCQVGYNSVAGLYRQFYKYYGMAPLEYRNLYK